MNDFKVYLLNLENPELSLRTIKRHLIYIGYILKNCPDFTFEQIEAYFASLKEKGNKNTYINHMIPTIRLYADFKKLEGYREHFKYRKEEKFEKSVMSQEEVSAFLSLACPKNWAKKEFFKATIFFSICFFTGMRPGECSHLTIDDIDFGLDVIHIRKGKTQESIGEVPISPNLRPLLEDYVKNLDTSKLFPSARGGGEGFVDTTWWNNQFHKRCKLLGIKRTNLSAYSSRHTYGSMLAWEDVNLYTIKELMRHTDIKTTERYMHRNLKSMKEAQKKLPLVREHTEPIQILQAMSSLVKGFHIEKDERFRYQLIEDESSIRFECAIVKKTSSPD